MDYKSIVDSWADRFKVGENLPSLDCIIPLLVMLNNGNFTLEQITPDFLEYVGLKFYPSVPEKHRDMFYNIIKKQILSVDLLLTHNKSAEFEFTPPSTDEEYLKSIGFDMTRLDN